MSLHALLAPSSAARWINCPPSALLNAGQGESETSAFAEEGTLAHLVCECKARQLFFEPMPEKLYKARLGELATLDYWQDEMEGYTDAYIDVLKGIAAEYDKPYVAVEQCVRFDEYVPDSYGTADCLMIGRCLWGTDTAGDTLHIIDFKYGKGIAVDAKDNPQLMLYALGALLEYAPIYDIEAVRMTIFQPRIRAEPVTWRMKAPDLLRWAKDTVKPAAALAAKGDGKFNEGEWCRFCAVRGNCRKRFEAQQALEIFGEKLPPTLTDNEIGVALTQGKRLKQWLSDVEEYALKACLDGREIAGWKAVRGRGTRAWVDMDEAFKAARAADVPEEMLYERKPVTLAALEKIMGKKAFKEALGDYVYTPEGKPTLVDESDKRAPITNRTSAKDDFNEDDDLPF